MGPKEGDWGEEWGGEGELVPTCSLDANMATVALVGEVATLPPGELAAVVAMEGERKPPRWEGEKEEDSGDSGCMDEDEEEEGVGRRRRTALRGEEVLMHGR